MDYYMDADLAAARSRAREAFLAAERKMRQRLREGAVSGDALGSGSVATAPQIELDSLRLLKRTIRLKKATDQSPRQINSVMAEPVEKEYRVHQSVVVADQQKSNVQIRSNDRKCSPGLRRGIKLARNVYLDTNIDDICHAEKVVAAYQQAQAGVTVLEGRLVEKPVIDRMMRILALAKAAGLRSR